VVASAIRARSAEAATPPVSGRRAPLDAVAAGPSKKGGATFFNCWIRGAITPTVCSRCFKGRRGAYKGARRATTLWPAPRRDLAHNVTGDPRLGGAAPPSVGVPNGPAPSRTFEVGPVALRPVWWKIWYQLTPPDSFRGRG